MKHSYIAKRFQSSGAGLSLDTEALAKYKDIIDAEQRHGTSRSPKKPQGQGLLAASS